NTALGLLENFANESPNKSFIETEINSLKAKQTPFKKDVYSVIRKTFRLTRGENNSAKTELKNWYDEQMKIEEDIYSSHLHSQSQWSATNVEKVDPNFSDQLEDGRVVLRDNFD